MEIIKFPTSDGVQQELRPAGSRSLLRHVTSFVPRSRIMLMLSHIHLSLRNAAQLFLLRRSITFRCRSPTLFIIVYVYFVSVSMSDSVVYFRHFHSTKY